MKMLFFASLALLSLTAAVDAAAVGEACDASTACTQDLVCDNKLCRVKLDAVCDNNDKCISNAACKDKGNAKACLCNDNFAPNVDNTKCLKKLGQACDAKEECIPNTECSGDKKCACGDKKVPSFAMDKCFVATGETCNAGSNDCGDNAACKQTKCACDADFVSRAGERCGKPVDTTCDKANECVTNADCSVEKKCKCKANYSPDDKFCSGASAALASVMLMFAALVASRWM